MRVDDVGYVRQAVVGGLVLLQRLDRVAKEAHVCFIGRAIVVGVQRRSQIGDLLVERGRLIRGWHRSPVRGPVHNGWPHARRLLHRAPSVAKERGWYKQ